MVLSGAVTYYCLANGCTLGTLAWIAMIAGAVGAIAWWLRRPIKPAPPEERPTFTCEHCGMTTDLFVFCDCFYPEEMWINKRPKEGEQK